MRNILLILLSTTIIVSCQNQPEKSEKELKSEISENIVLKNFEYISSGDMDSFRKTIVMISNLFCQEHSNGMMVGHYQEYTKDMTRL